ncbi:hypothetical protein pdam_00005518 [Pocillopora damicornis]|uniref:Uncharacterized protein n=1 Tax=Pocillopora damicornis TaxID=46731 RepID=A0A3M6TAH8_POCDA|nr:hypothetical protein pdam_00005518 [Pocillopora damicornis]
MFCNEFVLLDLKQQTILQMLIQIMNIGNQLYSRNNYLAILNVVDADYELEYSESYTGYQYFTSLQRAFESLLSQNYINFITVGIKSVSIYCNVDMGFKV